MLIKGEEYYSQSDILSLGWTKKLINDYLPAPILRTNPMYKSAAPMKTWPKCDVLSIMEREDFKVIFSKAQERKKAASIAASKGAETKRQNLLKDTEAFVNSITIEVIDDERLIKRAKQNAYVEYCFRHEDIDVSFKYYAQAEEYTVNRWVVNYIRHQLTTYDKRLFMFRGKAGKEEAAALLRDLILKRIAEVYPKYKDECFRQIKSRKRLLEYQKKLDAGDYDGAFNLMDYSISC